MRRSRAGPVLKRRGRFFGSLACGSSIVRPMITPISSRSLPQSHHPAVGIGEERERAHARHFLLLDEYLSACIDDLPAISREVVHVDVEGRVAGPGLRAI